ncbi:hypothetical protein PG984_013107 [Apiospora sp. TS-2023a]
MPPLSSYAWAPEKEHGAYGYDQLLEIIAANDAEALDEYLEKYNPQTIEEGTDEDWRIVRVLEEPGYWGDRFWEAIRFGSVDVYHQLVVYQRDQAAAGSNLLSPPESPLLQACQHDHVDMVRYLLRHSDDVAADLAAVGNYGRTALLAACDTRCEEIVGMLLDYGANVRDHTDWLYYDHGATGNERKGHETVLSLAIPYVGPALLRRLIDLGAPLHAPLLGFKRRYEGVTILHIAATYANSTAVEILLDTPEGREMAGMRDKLGRLPIHWAANCGHHDLMTLSQDLIRRAVETMKLLLPQSPVNGLDSLGNTPLHLAVRCSHMWSKGSSTEPAEGQDRSAFRHAISHLLLKNGADAALRNQKGETALGILVGLQFDTAPTELIARLLDRGGADVNEAADALGNMPLHHAARNLPRGLGAVRFLLGRGADPGLANADGDTPAHAAARSQGVPGENQHKDVSREIEQVLGLMFEVASSGSSGEERNHLRDRLNAAGMTPQEVLGEELADLARRIEKRGIEREKSRLNRLARGGYRGRGRGM